MDIIEKVKKIDEIQKLYCYIYGKYDLNNSMLWMVEECGEVISAIRKHHSKEDIKGELGDLLNWIFCLGNILEINVSDMIMGSYKKEIKRQLMKYGELHYADEDKKNEICQQYNEWDK